MWNSTSRDTAERHRRGARSVADTQTHKPHHVGGGDLAGLSKREKEEHGEASPHEEQSSGLIFFVLVMIYEAITFAHCFCHHPRRPIN